MVQRHNADLGCYRSVRCEREGVVLVVVGTGAWGHDTNACTAQRNNTRDVKAPGAWSQRSERGRPRGQSE